jgi:hypothetical protein
LAGCGSDDRSQAPESAAQHTDVGQLKYCLEGAGAVTAVPGKTIPELGKAPSGQDVQGAKRVLVVAWGDTKHSANVYYADTEAVAASAAGSLGKAVQQKGQVIIAPGEESPMSDDEALLASDCLP